MIRKITLPLLALLCLSVFCYAQKKKTPKATETPKEVPLIDRELFFDNPEISGGQLSPDGSMISFQKVYKGKMNVWVKKFDEPFDKAKPVTADTLKPIPGYFWSQDSKYILFVQDEGGNENFNVFAVDPMASPAASGAPHARNLTPLDSVRAIIYSVSRRNPDILRIGLNSRDKAWHDLYELSISTGKLTLLKENHDRLTAFYFDWDENLRLATRTADDGSQEILYATKDGFTKIYDCSVLETCNPAGAFDKDNRNFYLLSNKGDENFTKLYLFDPESKSVNLVEGDPLGKVDFGGLFISNKNRNIVLTSYTDAKTRYYFKDKTFEDAYKFIKSKFPEKEVSFFSLTRDEDKMLVNIYSDDDPGSTYFFDIKKKSLIKQYTPRPKLQQMQLAKMQPISYKSSDGLEIPAYLILPPGKEPKNLPAIVFPHGGPWARDYWGFSGYAQFLANRGYAVLLPNFRGSTGYGKQFLNAGNGEWGQKMQDDITWGVKHLVQQGIVDPARVGIMGGSYGGYATLAGLAFTPDVYAAGVDIVGPSNLITLLNSIPPYWEAARKVFNTRMGDPSTPEGKALLEKQSPLFSAKNIKAPLLVVQGANDPRVKKAESEQIVVALRELGVGVKYINAPDEGHGFRDAVNNMAMLAYAEKFLSTHLGGRYQESMKPEVSERLQKIMVDINTVALPDANTSAPEKLAPVSDLANGEYLYGVTLLAGEQKMNMELTRKVSEDGGNWVITETSKTPMGEIMDQNVISKGNLQPVRRKIVQGPANIEVEYSPDEVKGLLTMGTQKRPISVKLDHPITSDGAGLDLLIARLPLKENYQTTIAVFDVMSGKIKKMNVKVVGREQVKVPAGAFDAIKVTVTEIEGPSASTLWISPADKNTVKMEANVPQMGNGKLVMELTR